MKATLVVIDMQPTFEAADLAYKGVREAIHTFNKARLPVLFLAYHGYGSLYEDLFQAAKVRELVYKRTDDGSKEVREAIRGLGWPKTLFGCGVNTGACVLETLRGLFVPPFWRIHLITSACACSEDTSPQALVGHFKLRRLHLVDQGELQGIIHT